MSFIIKKPGDIKPSEITPKAVYMDRRRFMQNSLTASLLLTADSMLPAWARKYPDMNSDGKWSGLNKSPLSTSDKPNSFEDITTYNNFYEFGTGKQDPAKNATGFNPHPWSVTVEGHCDKPGTYDLDDFIKHNTLQEYVYRLRCVEGWSMVIPWVGFSLADMLNKFEPNSKAKFVEFTTLYDASRMPGQKRRVLNWPYVEGLRIDEAMNELPIMAVGLYGEVLPNQNGAPIRLVVPWKYGFKSIKSIVKIRFTEARPSTTWNETAPNEYGFYSNVNPNVDHPRWSQKKERVIGRPFWEPKRDTEMFNGYAEQVAHLYKGMDLTKYF